MLWSLLIQYIVFEKNIFVSSVKSLKMLLVDVTLSGTNNVLGLSVKIRENGRCNEESTIQRPNNKRGESRCSRRVSSFLILIDTRNATLTIK
jgi:hypothetical protein